MTVTVDHARAFAEGVGWLSIFCAFGIGIIFFMDFWGRPQEHVCGNDGCGCAEI